MSPDSPDTLATPEHPGTATDAVPATGAGDAPAALRHFLSFTGTRLPLNFTGELDGAALRHRNTFWRVAFDAEGRTLWAEQCVYGEVALRHDYRWHASGRLAEAVVQVPDEDPQRLQFDDAH